MRWARIGSAIALVADLLLLCDGHANLTQSSGLLGGFFDAQARALLHGRLAVPPGAVSFEGFRVGGQTYMYFGLVPALLRIPVLLVSHRLDGRLTQLSMLLAVVVAVEAAARLQWHVRERIRPGAPAAVGERGLVVLLAVAIGAGLPLYLVSWPVVYHEAELWGLALSLAALATTLGLINDPRPRRIVLAGVLCALAVNARISVGLGPVITLGLLGAGWTLAAVRGWRRARHGGPGVAREPSPPSPALGLLAIGGAALALATEISINLARFATPLGLPMYDHVAYHIDPTEHAAVLADHGAVFGLQYLPTTLISALSPGALSVTRVFPFLGLPAHVPAVTGSALFVSRLPSLSLVTAMPLLIALFLAGLLALARQPRARPLLAGLVGCAAAFATTLTVSSVATRYLADAVPLLALGACASLQAILARGPHGRGWRAARAGLVVLGAAGVLIIGAAGLVQQRLLAPTASPDERAGFVAWQLNVARALGLRPPLPARGRVLPATAPGAPGDLFVLGHCDGLYVTSTTATWLDAERGRAAGLVRLRARLGGARGPARALLSTGGGPRRVTLTLAVPRGGPRVAVRAGRRVLATGPALRGLGGRPVTVTVSFDALASREYVSVTVAGRPALANTQVPYRPGEPLTLGRGAGVAPFGGGLRLLPDRVGVCERLARAAGLAGFRRS